ncbi:MAG: carbohydrate ABC transporter permease [Acidimicrobiales bacterium]
MTLAVADQAPVPSGGTYDPGRPPDGEPRGRRGGRRSRSLPYVLIFPTLALVALVLGYPIVRLGILSLQRFGLPQQFGAPPEWVGLGNFRAIVGDPYFWAVLQRTVIFCAVNVVLTMVLGTLVAVLLGRLGRRMRTLVSTGLLLAWAMPALTATVVWQWIFDTNYGLVNWLLTELGGDFRGHGWLTDPLSFYAVATLIVVWMGVPFVAFTLHAGITQIPSDTLEAAAIDGAGPWQRFRDIVVPAVKPLLLVLVALSTMWDLKVFIQIYVLQRAGGITRETNLLGVWAYRESIGQSRFDIGAAVALVLVAITVLLTLVHVRQMVRQEDL